MAHTHERGAIIILDWLHRTEASLVGKVVATFNGEAGVVREIKLDDAHGLCFTIDDKPDAFDIVERNVSQRWYPVSTIRHLSKE